MADMSQTEAVRRLVVWAAVQDPFVAYDEAEAAAKFDEWLAAHDREQLQQGWEEGVMDSLGKPWLDVPARHSGFHRYREVGS